MRPLLVIRPEPGNTATAAAARALGLAPIALPLFAMAPVDWEVPDPAPYAGILAGSANLFRLGGEGLASLRGLPVHAVGAATAEAARAAGFAVAGIGEGGLQPLVAALPPARYLRLAGEKHVPLREPAGVVVDTRVVYAARGRPIPAECVDALAGGAVVMLHSGEAADHWARETHRLALHPNRFSLACLAPRIASRAGVGWQSVEIAPARSDDSLLEIAAQMCQTL